MADIPNINTADVGIIAFWNAEDHKTAGVVDPLDCTGVFTAYDVYDNGLDGYKTLGSGRHFNCRVKNDGWCVAWIDRTNTFGHPTLTPSEFGESGYKGYYDILWDWFNPFGNISSTLTTLSYILSLLEAALETSGNFTFAATDVGHYCYEFTSANVLTMLDVQKTEGTQVGYVQYTPGTSIMHASVGASAKKSGDYPLTTVRFGGNVLVTSPSLHQTRHGTADILANNWMPNPLTDYEMYVTTYDMHTSYGHISVLILWA